MNMQSTACMNAGLASLGVRGADRRKAELSTNDLGPSYQATRRFTPAELKDLAIRIKAGDPVAREALSLSNLGLVMKIAHLYYSAGATIDDHIQEGNHGLIEAAERYDPESHNASFATYATFWIRNRIRRSVEANDSLIRRPAYMFRLNCRSSRADGRSRTGEEAALSEQEAPRLGARSKTPRGRRRRQVPNYSVISASSRYDYDEGTDLEKAIVDRHDYNQEIEASENLDKLHRALDLLTPVEAWLIRRRFGFDDPQEDSPQESNDAGTATNAKPNRIWTHK